METDRHSTNKRRGRVLLRDESYEDKLIRLANQTLEEDIAELKAMDNSGDVEVNHIDADRIICKYIPSELFEAYDNVRKWYA